MNTIIPMHKMPAHEVHGSQKGRSVVFSIVYTDGFIDTQLIKESRNNIDVPDLAEIPAHEKHGAAIATSLYALVVYDDKFVDSFTSISRMNQQECCPGPCNPLVQLCP